MIMVLVHLLLPARNCRIMLIPVTRCHQYTQWATSVHTAKNSILLRQWVRLLSHSIHYGSALGSMLASALQGLTLTAVALCRVLGRTEWDWEQRLANTVMLQQHRRHLEVLPPCWLFDQPVNLLDRVLVAHMCQMTTPKVQEKVFYYGYWDRQWSGEELQEGGVLV